MTFGFEENKNFELKARYFEIILNIFRNFYRNFWNVDFILDDESYFTFFNTTLSGFDGFYLKNVSAYRSTILSYNSQSSIASIHKFH